MTELSQASEEDLRPQIAANPTAGDQFECGIGKPRHARRRRLIKLQRDKGGTTPSLGAQEAAEPSTSPSDSSESSFSTASSSSENLPELEEGDKGAGSGEVVVTCVSHGMSSVMGRRREMEDTVRVELGFVKAEAEAVASRSFDYFGVFDGHGGAQVAEACRNRMHRILEREIALQHQQVIDWERVMGRCFERMDFEISGPRDGGVPAAVVGEKTVGSTAVVAVVGSEEVVVANCGDSRAVICRNGTAVPLTVDHKPDRDDELARIEAAGGKVINWNGYRVLGVLATSRSIGDEYLKPFVIAKPEVTVCSRTDEDEFIILGSDGLWDVVSNEVACQVTRRCLEGRIRRDQAEGGGANRALRAASLLVELAIARGSRDNISAVVVQLKRRLKGKSAK